MKKTLLAAIIFATITLSATKLNAQTTMEEYNYVTKGYKVQMESGLDMKKNYELQDIDVGSTTEEERKVTLKKLIRVAGTEKKTVAYMLIYQKGNEPKEYICIPQPNSEKEITNLYWKSLLTGKEDTSFKLQLIAFVLSKNLMW